MSVESFDDPSAATVHLCGRVPDSGAPHARRLFRIPSGAAPTSWRSGEDRAWRGRDTGGVRAVEEDAALCHDPLHLWTGPAGDACGGLVVRVRDGVVLSGQADVPRFAPALAPAVPHEPVALARPVVAVDGHDVVQGAGRLCAAAAEDAAAVGRPVGGDVHCHGSDRRHGRLERHGVVLGELCVAAVLDGGPVGRARRVLAMVAQVLFQGQALRGGPIEGQLWHGVHGALAVPLPPQWPGFGRQFTYACGASSSSLPVAMA
mmetsp:Transcript_11374/g.30347  ORF Transcript_11374/g.30347 Transcript_11374/m.30347 type:complete len:261 (-) Transcript_11374:208-990(-)